MSGRLHLDLFADPIARSDEEKQISMRELADVLATANDEIEGRFVALREKWFEQLLGPEREALPSSSHFSYIRRLSPLESIYTKERATDVCLATVATTLSLGLLITYPLTRLDIPRGVRVGVLNWALSLRFLPPIAVVVPYFAMHRNAVAIFSDEAGIGTVPILVVYLIVSIALPVWGLATNRPAFRSFVLGFLDHAELLAPAELRADLVDWVRDLASADPR